jgi:hypothetical protein
MKEPLETQSESWPPLLGIEIFAFPTSSGPLSRFGRNLRIKFPEFLVTFKQDNITKQRKLVSSVVSLSKNICEGSVDAERNVIAPLPSAGTPEVQRRIREELLEVHRFPTTTFRPLHEDAQFLRGLLELHGEQREITCVKSVTNENLFVKCPLDMRDYKIPQHTSFFGALRVDMNIDVVVKIPLSVLKAQGRLSLPQSVPMVT